MLIYLSILFGLTNIFLNLRILRYEKKNKFVYTEYVKQYAFQLLVLTLIIFLVIYASISLVAALIFLLSVGFKFYISTYINQFKGNVRPVERAYLALFLALVACAQLAEKYSYIDPNILRFALPGLFLVSTVFGLQSIWFSGQTKRFKKQPEENFIPKLYREDLIFACAVLLLHGGFALMLMVLALAGQALKIKFDKKDPLRISLLASSLVAGMFAFYLFDNSLGIKPIIACAIAVLLSGIYLIKFSFIEWAAASRDKLLGLIHLVLLIALAHFFAEPRLVFVSSLLGMYLLLGESETYLDLKSLFLMIPVAGLLIPSGQVLGLPCFLAVPFVLLIEYIVYQGCLDGKILLVKNTLEFRDLDKLFTFLLERCLLVLAIALVLVSIFALGWSGSLISGLFGASICQLIIQLKGGKDDAHQRDVLGLILVFLAVLCLVEVMTFSKF